MNKKIPRAIHVNSQIIDDARREFVANNRIDLLADRTGIRQGRLYDKLNPEQDTKPFDLDLLVAVTAQSGDLCLVEGLVRAFDHHMFARPQAEADTSNIVSLVMKRHKVAGDFAALLDKALDDGNLDDGEKSELIASLDEAMVVITKLRAHLVQSNSERA